MHTELYHDSYGLPNMSICTAITHEEGILLAAARPNASHPAWTPAVGHSRHC